MGAFKQQAIGAADHVEGLARDGRLDRDGVIDAARQHSPHLLGDGDVPLWLADQLDDAWTRGALTRAMQVNSATTSLLVGSQVWHVDGVYPHALRVLVRIESPTELDAEWVLFQRDTTGGRWQQVTRRMHHSTVDRVFGSYLKLDRLIPVDVQADDTWVDEPVRAWLETAWVDNGGQPGLAPFTPPSGVRLYGPDNPDNPLRRHASEGGEVPHALLVGDIDDGGIVWAGTRDDLRQFVNRLAAALDAECGECGARPGEACREYNCQGSWV